MLIKERLGHLPGTIDENYQLIRKSLPIFSDLSEPQFREMLIDSPVHLKKPGEIIFERLDYTATFWSIVRGTVEAHIGPQANSLARRQLLRRARAHVRAAA